VSTRDEFPFHVEGEHFAVTIVPRQFPKTSTTRSMAVPVDA